MHGTWLRYLGLLGFLGLLGPLTGNAGLSGFFGFFGFFAFGGSTSDERLEYNVNKASRNAFVVSTLLLALSIAYTALTASTSALPYAVSVAVAFAGQLLTFSISLAYYESSGKGY